MCFLLGADICKCEDLSHETDAWVFFSAQHPSASGLPISFASEMLCSEASDTAGKMATDFSRAAARLLYSKRANAVELQHRLEEANMKKNEAETRVESQQELLNLYRERFGAIEAPGTVTGVL